MKSIWPQGQKISNSLMIWNWKSCTFFLSIVKVEEKREMILRKFQSLNICIYLNLRDIKSCHKVQALDIFCQKQDTYWYDVLIRLCTVMTLNENCLDDEILWMLKYDEQGLMRHENIFQLHWQIIRIVLGFSTLLISLL